MGRLTPSVRLSNQTPTSGAQSTTCSTPAGAGYAVIGFHYYSGVSSQDPTNVFYDGQQAVLIDSAHDSASNQVSLYKVPIVSTGAGKVLAWVNANTYGWLGISIEFRSGIATHGAHGSQFNGGAASTSSTASLANSNGDEIISAYSADGVGTLSFGTGQTDLDQTNDATNGVYYGQTSELATGAGDVQSVTGDITGIASTVVTTTQRGPPIPPPQFNRRHANRRAA